MTKQIKTVDRVIGRTKKAMICGEEVRVSDLDHCFIDDVSETKARQEAVKLAEKRVAVAYQKALLEVGKISPGLLQQINALAYEAMQKGQNE